MQFTPTELDEGYVYVKLTHEEASIAFDAIAKSKTEEKPFMKKYFLNKYLLFDVRQSIIRYSIGALINGGVLAGGLSALNK